MTPIKRFHHRPWAEAVFHVLAHVSATGPGAAALFDAHYVSEAARTLGAAEQRCLAEDAQLLGGMLSDPGCAATVQLLAWLFDDYRQAVASGPFDLEVLTPQQVARPCLLTALGEVGLAAELLRCAALLELPLLLRRWPCQGGPLAAQGALDEVAAAAPALHGCRVGNLRSLRLRGRLFEREVWVGMPGEKMALSRFHVAWQAAHEATVGEVARWLDHDGSVALESAESVERVALVVLEERASDAALARTHAHWREHLAPGYPRKRQRLTLAEQMLMTDRLG